MPFTFLPRGCLLSRKTSVQEGELRAVLIPEDDEEVFVFHLDSDEFRKEFGIGNTRKVCDYLFFYRRRQGRVTIFFVELKKSRIKDGIAQLRSTIELVRPRLPDYARGDLVAVVVKWGAAPPDLSDFRQRFLKELRVRLYVASGRVDLRPFLRSKPSAAE
jgi:hypothetical protein